MGAPPLKINRRNFLSCSAAAGIAWTQGGEPAVAAGLSEGLGDRPVTLGVIGCGGRGTTLIRGLLSIPQARISAVVDLDSRHRRRAVGIIARAQGAGVAEPAALESIDDLLQRPEIEAVVVALPCDLHASCNTRVLESGKHLYAEKPLALTLAECDLLIEQAARRPELTVRVGFQRRSNPRFREAVALARSGELGRLLEGRASWISSNGPVSGSDGWMGHRQRSGDWMVEQAVHVWDIFQWIQGSPPARAYGLGHRGVFEDAAGSGDRDVTDLYVVLLEWPDGFHLVFTQSWVDPAEESFTGVKQKLIGSLGGLDLGSGVAVFRSTRPRKVLTAPAEPDTTLALREFLAAIRSPVPLDPPISLVEARDATLTAWLARTAIDERREVRLEEIGRPLSSSRA